ncbi:hypothetical protein K461DRAFT_267782 [Myriangium duriaei CBS 260.36]|uniref:Uncharacterized protein n=1 Tax=Myriangium duriaei CBS 260.36 TaxID=1168546 RepID=A0A9P4J6A2_9PEZI|nr:hypothetical protein K461DRAFT_267782 [Myriangium duriaei CBS 260.36]
MPNFVFVDQNASKDAAARKRIRSHAMVDFRRRQRQERKSSGKNEQPSRITSNSRRESSGDIGHQRISRMTRFRIVRPSSAGVRSEDTSSDSVLDDESLETGSSGIDRHNLLSSTAIVPLSSRSEERQEDLSLLPGSLTSSWNRVHMQNKFCDLFYPDGRNAIHDLFESIRPVSWAEQLTVNAGDALCTLQVAIIRSDRRMLQASIKLQNMALRRLRDTVNRTGRHQSTDSLIGAVYYLLKWESLMAMSWSSPTWQYHYDALLRLLYNEKSSIGSGASEPPKFLRFTFCYALSMGLVTRRPVHWIPMERRKQPVLISAALEVPSCIAALDAALASQMPADRVQRTITSGLALRSKLLTLLSTYPPTFPGDTLYHLEDISRFVDFDAALSNNVQSLYQQVFSFSSFETAIGLKTLWTSLLVLDQTLLNVHRQPKIDLDAIFTRDFLSLETNIEDWVDKLCRTIPYFTLPSCKFSGALCIMEPLHFVSEYFQSKGSRLHLEWCKCIRDYMVPGHRVARLFEMSDSSDAPTL